MRLLRTLLASPLLWGLVALGFFLIGLCPWAFPGEGADFMARTLGLLPASNAHPLAGLFYGAFGACLPAGAAVAAMNAASAVFGALCVALLCALVRGLLYSGRPSTSSSFWRPPSWSCARPPTAAPRAWAWPPSSSA